jgi:phospholipid/cholesterol/gamma-HCH transport system permease protein
MTAIPSPHGALIEMGRAALRWLAGWWQIIHLGAVILVLALSPSSYDRAQRSAMARHLYLGTAPILPWFTVLSSLISVVVIRIVVVTALGYGLSKYALEMVVRVLVLELIPLTSAIFVALRCAIPNAAEVAGMRTPDGFAALTQAGADALRREVLPRVVASLFSVLMLAAVACVVTLLLAYLSVHGLASGAFPSYTRTVGRVFGPAVALIFAVKTVLLGLAVALIPIATVLFESGATRPRVSAELQALVRLFMVILLIEVASLIGNYY